LREKRIGNTETDKLKDVIIISPFSYGVRKSFILKNLSDKGGIRYPIFSSEKSNSGFFSHLYDRNKEENCQN